MVKEAVDGLHVEKSRKFIDTTLGNGGHAIEILERGGKVLGIDLDPEMVAIATRRIGKDNNFKAVCDNFANIARIAKENGFEEADGILFDLGVTNIHLKDLERGFSFENPEAELDMRINPEVQGIKAKDLLNILREDQLRQMFEVTLNPGAAKWIAGRVLFSRSAGPITNVGDMLEICEGLKTGKKGLSEATLPFLALRIAVNSELDNLRGALPDAYGLLRRSGRLVVISFHSGEERIVKDFFREKISEGAKQITFKPVSAGIEELEKNRRARSAKMRIIEKF